MSDFYDAFQELKGLEDATFSFDKPGILKLNTFLNMDDDEDNTLIVVDPDAETAEDTQGKDYNGEVILKCDICGGLITKAPEDVVIDEETQKANVEEECPYCFNVGGYDIVGEIKVPETLEYEEVDEFGDRTNDTEKDAVGYDIPSDDNVEEDFTGGPVEYVERTGGVDIYKTADGKYSATVRGKSLTADTVDGLKAKLAGKDEEDRKHLDSLPEDYDKDAGKIAKFIEDAVNGLKNGEATNYRYKLDDRFAIFVGWSDGYSEDDKEVIHNDETPTAGITAGIKVWTSDDMWTDFDYLNAPYYEGGDVLSDELAIAPDDDFTVLASHFLNDYDSEYSELTVDEDGKVIEEDEEIEEDLSKDDVNIIGRKEAAKRFNKGEEIYVGLKGNRDLWGFVKDDETPTFKDVEDYVTDDGAVKASDIVYAVANTPKKVDESCKKGRKKIDESVKIISTLDEYTPWSGAKNTYAVIQDADKVDALDAYLEDIYPEGLTVTELNDLLWFDGDSVLSDLGIYTEDAIDTAIQDAVDEAQGESFEDTDELEFFLTRHIEDAMNGVSVNIDISDEEVEITVEDTTRSFALTDFTIGEIEESLKEAKEEVEDFYDVVYDTITGQKKIKGTSNPIRGCMNPDNMGIDRETGNMLAKCRTEKEADKVEKYVKDMFGDEGVTTIRKKNKHDKDFPIGVVIDVPEERIIKDIEDKVVTTDESLTESVEGVTVTTDTDVVNVDVTDTDGVTVDVQGKDSVDNTEEATIEPVSDETKEEIVANSEEGESEEGAEGEMLSDEFDEFNEEEFDELGESYLKEVYDNVKSFKTTRGVMDKDRIKLEGIIEFNSGKKAKTSFVFEKYMTTPRGKFKLLGENLQLTSRKNAFILTGSIQERKLCMEALTYKYTAKDAKGGKSKQVYGTKKVTK